VVIHAKQEEGRLTFKATTSLDKATKDVKGLKDALRGIEIDYAATIAAARRAISDGHRARGSDSRAYWLAGKQLNDFLRRLESQGHYLVRKNHTMAAHLGIGRASVEKIISFHLRYESPSKIDLSIPWGVYRDNKEASR
jgi:hypothetical protein